MASLLTQELHRELEGDRLRGAGHRTPDNARHRRAGFRRAVGTGLISLGERVRGCTRQPVAPLRRT